MKTAKKSKKNAEALRVRQERARAEGRCLWCSQPAADGQSLCDDHAAAQRDRYRAKREAGLCVRCGEPSQGSAQCNTCKAKHTERERLRRLGKKRKRSDPE